VSEGLTLAAQAKTAVSESFAQTGAAPLNRTAAGMTATAGDTNGNYVSALLITNGVIQITYTSGGSQRANAAINGNTLTLVPYVSADNSVSWKCRVVGSTAAPAGGLMPGAANAVGTLPARYAPAECRA
jgi:type IV pilus assembly protein PilA